MTDLDALLAGIVADPANAVRWLVMADWLEENGQPERAELVRVHRELLRTCTATRETKARKQLHARMMELMRAGVQPCLPQRTVTLPGGVEMRFSFIPPGSFLMGSPKSEPQRKANQPRHEENERRHRVTLTIAYCLGVSPVTQRQWQVVMDSTPSHFQGENLPVETISWDDTQVFCAAVTHRLGLTVRLPTEAEWEYAARAGTTTPFYWGNELNGTQASCDGSDPYGTKVAGPASKATAVVGSYTGVSPHPWGMADMLGNVWEWCADWHHFYPKVDQIDPVGPESRWGKSLRGGSWSNEANCCRAAFRDGPSPIDAFYDIGFRLAADLSALA